MLPLRCTPFSQLGARQLRVPTLCACRQQAVPIRARPAGLSSGACALHCRSAGTDHRQKRVTNALAFDAIHQVHSQDYIATLLASPYRDSLCFVFTFLGALVWVKLFDFLGKQGLLEQKLSRKLVHSTAGPLLVLCWPLFSDAPMARFLAAATPALNFLRLFLVGNGWVQDPGLVKSVSRQGDRAELLKGPLYYVIVLIAATLLFWREQPAGLLAISTMCGGDGLADIVGRRFGSAKLPWNSGKSWAGSAAMFIGGTAMAMGYAVLFCHLGYFTCPPTSYLPVVATVCMVATIVESLPVNTVIDDNLSVPVVSALLGMLLMAPR